MKNTIISGALLSALSYGAMADTPSFNFVEAGYVRSNTFGDVLAEGGFKIKGNFELSEYFYINADYETTSIRGNNPGVLVKSIPIDEIDYKNFAIGLGYKIDISDNTVFFTQFDLLEHKKDFGKFGSDSKTGYQIGVGLRSFVSENLELKAAFKYYDVFRSDTGLELGAVYNVTDSTAIYLDAGSSTDGDLFGVGVRFSF